MKVLVIYEHIPEDTMIYLIEEEEKETLEKIKSAYNQYANVCGFNEDGAIWLNEYLGDKKVIELKEGEPIDTSDVDFVVHSGWML